MSEPTNVSISNTYGAGDRTCNFYLAVDMRNEIVSINVSAPYNSVELPRDPAQLRQLAADLVAAAGAIEDMHAAAAARDAAWPF